jgi:hypothetical protein
MLLGASCGGSSGGSHGDALGGGGAPGPDGAAGSGPPSGSAATDASAPTGGPGGGYGGSGGGGGTPSACSDPAYPVSCPAHGDVPAICWSPGTDCSTLTKCGDQFRSCTSATSHFDCAAMRCISAAESDGGTGCGDPAYPVACPAHGDVPDLCWSSGTICSTIGRCGNDFKSCLGAGYHFDCTVQRCVADSTTPSDAAPGPDAPGDARADSD